MKFKEFVENCNKLLEEQPEVGDCDTVYARDDEGNGYQSIYFTPTLGIKESDDYCFDFIALDNVKEEPEDYDYTEKDLNAVCIN